MVESFGAHALSQNTGVSGCYGPASHLPAGRFRFKIVQDFQLAQEVHLSSLMFVAKSPAWLSQVLSHVPGAGRDATKQDLERNRHISHAKSQTIASRNIHSQAMPRACEDAPA